MSHKLFLIDGTAVIYRAYFAFIRNPLINSKGQNTGAVFGTLNSFLRLVEKYDVKYVAVSFDLPGKTFRHEITDTYKANRPPAPDDLIAQIKPIKNFFALIGLKEISLPGFEADDVLATLAEEFKKDYQIVLVTGDKDFVQLVDDRVMLYDPFKEKVVQKEEVKKKYGLEPDQFIDYLALCGDSSDNIPGVNGIGPKGAVKLLDQFGDLENIYQNLDKIQNSGIRSKLETSRENAFLSQKLARIVRNVPLDKPSVADLSFQFNDLEKALPLLAELELNSITRKIQSREVESQDVQQELDLGINGISSHVEKSPSEEFKTIIVDDIAKFNDLKKDLEQQEFVALDTETSSQYPIQAELVGISLCFEQNKAYYLPVSHKLAENLDTQKIIAELPKSLENKTLIAHNFKYDYLILLRSGWEVNNNVFDTMIADYLLHPTQRHSLAACAQREFGYAMTPIKELIGSGKKEITFDLVPVTQAAAYASADAWITWRLYDQYQIQLQQENLDVLFSRIELPLFRVLARMEMNGVYVDPDILTEISKKNQKE
ncbi:MAG: DNA polymerase I, partial [Candidatus Cloacimonetes bacterium]|nr:DNA polymerase I [Candidatus Cloacimonadota bacterium]